MRGGARVRERAVYLVARLSAFQRRKAAPTPGGAGPSMCDPVQGLQVTALRTAVTGGLLRIWSGELSG